MQAQQLNELITRQKHGYALEREFYMDPDIYEHEIERIFMKVWLYAGHVSEIPNPGDYLLFEMDRESVIVIRDRDGGVNALQNVCRHRGSRVCTVARGSARRLTCPYHGWTYDTSGRLIAAAHMDDSFDKSKFGLKQVTSRVFEGLIFVTFAEDPAPFELIDRDLGPYLAPYRLSDAKVARRASYPITSNWKFAVENYKECYHCAPAHPEYAHAHSLALPAEKWQSEMEALMERMPACGMLPTMMDQSYVTGAEFGADRAYEHYPLLRGHLTGSRDGKPVAPLLGDLKGFDSGAHDFKIGPFLFALAYSDHVVLYRFTPLAVDECDCDISWLVNGDAEEGKDYDLSNLTWLWDVTTKADKRIIEHNHGGVMSRYFEPGPFSSFEYTTQKWVKWYLNSMQ